MLKGSVSRERLFVGDGKFSLEFRYEECKDCGWTNSYSGKVREIPAELQEKLGVRDANFYLAVLYSVRSVAASRKIGNKVEVAVDGEIRFSISDSGSEVSFS